MSTTSELDNSFICKKMFQPITPNPRLLKRANQVWHTVVSLTPPGVWLNITDGARVNMNGVLQLSNGTVGTILLKERNVLRHNTLTCLLHRCIRGWSLVCTQSTGKYQQRLSIAHTGYLAYRTRTYMFV